MLAAEVYRKHWPNVPNAAVRVFFVVPSEERLRNIALTIKDLPGGDYVRLAVAGDVTAQRVFTDPIWRTVGGETRPILRNSLGKT